MRLCANTGAQLHLVRPLGFSMSDQRLRRAGLDYRERALVTIHTTWQDLQDHLAGHRFLAVDTTGQTAHSDARFHPGDVLVFGSEPTGLPESILSSFPAHDRLRVPMVPGSRSLNLANAVAVVTYEAWRQNQFAGGG